MTDNDIIKALECCGCDNYQCDNCPYAYKTCTVYKDSIDLINRQKAEIERLKALAEAIKEFADKAVEKLTENYSGKYCRWIDDTIDSLLKEMEEEEE